MKLVNSAAGYYFRSRKTRIDNYLNNPIETQEKLLKELIHQAKDTVWGKKYDFASIKDIKTFAERVPVGDYDSHKPFINEMMHGKSDILWPGVTRWFSKSSGTTNDKSKFIPVSETNLETCHKTGPRDTLSFLFLNYKNPTMFGGDYLGLVGFVNPFEPHPQSQCGDISAIMVKTLPSFYRMFYLPSLEIAFLSEWEEKLQKTAEEVIHRNIVALGGVPTWNLVLFRKILEITGKKNMLEVWPNLNVYLHGGVSFKPYRKQFEELIPSKDMNYLEVYNASEGYFASQMRPTDKGLTLLLNNGIFYEFIPMEEWDKENPKAVSLADVELDKVYSMIISTNAGLWRYQCGDTVKFISKSPYQIIIVGRTKHFINVFGEELMIANTDKALEMTCETLNCVVEEYTAAPVFFKNIQGKGGHEWAVEFSKEPASYEDFADLLDKNLQKINSDYEAKRYRDMALERLKINIVPKGTFLNWMSSRGKVGGQNKVPRLANERKHLEGILDFYKNTQTQQT
jgi:hypothetical protein